MARIYCVFALSLALGGCIRADVGECNLDDSSLGPAALSLAFQASDGLPMYEGQALIQSTCGNGGFCHSPAALRDGRFGAPKGLDFHVGLACANESDACSNLTPCGADDASSYCLQLDRLESNRDRTVSLGSSVVGQVKSGAMPPGAAGQQVRSAEDWVRVVNGAPGPTLPSIDSKEGRQIVRNWIACKSPVVARTLPSPSAAEELTECPNVDGEVCVYRGPSQVPDPNWSSIYFEYVLGNCVTCHGPANGNSDLNADRMGQGIPGGASSAGLAALDLSGADPANTAAWAGESHARIVGVATAAGGACDGAGDVIVANDPDASIWIQKLRNEQTCGDRMPLSGTPPLPGVIAVMEQWINGGAPND